MLFRTRIFIVIMAVGLIPAVILLLASAYLLNSTLNRVGASGLESSIEAAGTMVRDAETKLGGIMERYLSEDIPWEQPNKLDNWRNAKGLDIIYRSDGEILNWSLSDSIDIDSRLIKNRPIPAGLSHMEFNGVPILLFTQVDSSLFYGCGILMPEGYAEKGQMLSGAVSASASLAIYKKFSLQLLSAITGGMLIFVLISGFILSRLVSARLVKPLERVTEGAARFGGGDLEYKVRVEGNDEFTGLSVSFNKMASEILENQKRLIEAERLAAWREVARRMAHDIKNPLTPVTVELYRLKTMLAEASAGKSVEAAKSLESISAQIKTLQDLAGHFSTFAKEPQLQKERCSLADILNESIALYKKYDYVTISTAIPDDLPQMQLDPQMMGRVLGNIIKNSIEASPESVKIDIIAGKADNYIRIIIKDDGPGFPAEKLEHIDTPYITTKKSGTGLGLAIIKKIIDEHDGKAGLTIGFFGGW